MKNKLLKGIWIGLIVLLSTTDLSQAGDSISIPVSCSIPAIPGLNAPPFPEEKSSEIQSNAQDTRAQGETEENRSLFIQEESKKEIQLIDGKTTSVIVQTIYSR